MGKFRDRPAERVVDLLLAKGIVEVVVAADHMGNAHVVIVDDDRKIVGRGAVGPQDYQIVELGIDDRHLSLDLVTDRRRAVLRRLQPDRRRNPGRSLGRIAIAPRAVIADRALLGSRPLAHRLQLGRGAIAVIGVSRGEQLPRDFSVTRGALELVDDFAVPPEAQPVEPVDDRRHCLRRRPDAVGILDAQQEFAPVVPRKEPIEQRCARPADMQKPGRRRGETDHDAHLCGSSFRGAGIARESGNQEHRPATHPHGSRCAWIPGLAFGNPGMTSHWTQSTGAANPHRRRMGTDAGHINARAVGGCGTSRAGGSS